MAIESTERNQEDPRETAKKKNQPGFCTPRRR